MESTIKDMVEVTNESVEVVNHLTDSINELVKVRKAQVAYQCLAQLVHAFVEGELTIASISDGETKYTLTKEKSVLDV